MQPHFGSEPHNLKLYGLSLDNFVIIYVLNLFRVQNTLNLQSFFAEKFINCCYLRTFACIKVKVLRTNCLRILKLIRSCAVELLLPSCVEIKKFYFTLLI